MPQRNFSNHDVSYYAIKQLNLNNWVHILDSVVNKNIYFIYLYLA